MDFHLLINGELVTGASELEIINPATEKVIVKAPVADIAQLEQAVEAAKSAQKSWANQHIEFRGDCLKKLAMEVEQHADELANLLTLEVGRPLPLAHFELQLVQKSCLFFSEQKLDTEVLVEDEAVRVEERHEPIGVVAAILPWNAPLYLAINKLAPALMAGNTIILKPAPTSPLATLKFGELINKVFPAGVVNVITDKNDLGPALVAHKDIAKIAFTGSSATGKKILASAAAHLKRVTLELSGNDPAIILPDVDVRAIVPALVFGAFFNSGQICAVIKRLYVHESIYDELCNEMASVLNNAVVGDGLNPKSEYGPIQNKEQFEKVKTFLEEAHKTGTIICGGQVLDQAGYFIPPTLVRDISDGHRLVDEEPFGPILPIVSYADIDNVIDRANDSPLGLGASVWSADVKLAENIGERIEAGTVWINQHCAIDPSIPFPTTKQSGIGVEGGRAGLMEYTNLKIFNIQKGG